MNAIRRSPDLSRRFALLGVSACWGQQASAHTWPSAPVRPVPPSHPHSCAGARCSPCSCNSCEGSPSRCGPGSPGSRWRQHPASAGDQSGQDQSGQQDNSGGPDTSTALDRRVDRI